MKKSEKNIKKENSKKKGEYTAIGASLGFGVGLFLAFIFAFIWEVVLEKSGNRYLVFFISWIIFGIIGTTIGVLYGIFKKMITINKTPPRISRILVTLIYISLIVIFLIFLVLNWKQEMWKEVEFDVREGSVFTDIFEPIIASLEHTFSSKNNIIFLFAMPLASSVLLTILVYIFFNKKKLYHLGELFSILGLGIPILLIIIIHIVMFFVCNSIIAFIYNALYGIFFISLLPNIILMTKSCYKCDFFNTKECIDVSSSTFYDTKYVEGGYKTVKADVKDKQSGNVVGTIETKVYEDGYSYTTSRTTKIKTFRCSNCGNITQSKSSS